jgi:antitoxin HicB
MTGQQEDQAVDFALAADEIMAAIRELHESGGVDDVFGRLPEETEPPRTTEADATESPRYSMVIQWSDEDRVLVVSLPEWGALVHTHGATYEDAVQHGKELIEWLIAARQESGEPLPSPQMFAGA